MIRAVSLAAIAAIGLVVAPAANAVLIFTADLGPELAGSSGTGSGLVTYDEVAHTLTVSANWSGLTGTTTVAHIHCCVAPPGTVGVAVTPGTFPGFPTGTTSGTYLSPTPIDLTLAGSYTGGATGFLTRSGGTPALAEAALLQGMLAGQAYLNIHTTFAPGGEIRGFLKVPEPASLALFVVGLLGLAAGRRRARS